VIDSKLIFKIRHSSSDAKKEKFNINGSKLEKVVKRSKPKNRCYFLEEENKSRLVVIGDIVFVKPCLFKGRIETESWSGLKKYYEMMEREVQLERKPDRETTNSPDAIDNTGAQVPTSRRSGSGNKVRTADSGLTKTSPELERKSDSSLVLGEQTLSFAFLLVILTLMIITLALFKLASAIATLSERLGTIEELLERYALICLDPAMKYHGEESVS